MFYVGVKWRPVQEVRFAAYRQSFSDTLWPNNCHFSLIRIKLERLQTDMSLVHHLPLTEWDICRFYKWLFSHSLVICMTFISQYEDFTKVVMVCAWDLCCWFAGWLWPPDESRPSPGHMGAWTQYFVSVFKELLCRLQYWQVLLRCFQCWFQYRYFLELVGSCF